MSSTYSPTNMDTDSEITSFIEESTPSITTSTNSINTISKVESKLDYNDPNFTLESDSESKAYIFKNKLFTRELLPIELDKERQILVKCTS